MRFQGLDPIRKYISNHVNKKSIFYLGIIILVSLLSLLLIWYFSRMPESPQPTFIPKIEKEKTMEEIIKDLTAPQATATPQVSEKVIKSLTAPKEKGVSKDIIKSLTAPRK